MKVVFSGIVSEGLDNPDCQTILSLFESKDLFALHLCVLLLPLKNFFNSGMLDNRYSLIVVEKPLNYIGHRIDVHTSGTVTKERRSVLLFSRIHFLKCFF